VIWVLLTVVAVLLVAAFAALLTGRVGYDPMAPPTGTAGDPTQGLPVDASRVADLRFDTALRGYRMDQVDDVLDRLQARLADQERELRELRDAHLHAGERRD